ncbi:MAG TPA: DUF6683 family protein [Blastocatellia bacterium]|nr:DUF6683 family protein [Blastocatellia bacterium]
MNRLKMLSAILTLGFTLLSLLGLSRPAAAQYTNPFTGRTFNNPMSSFADTLIMQKMQQQMLLKTIERRRNQTASAPQAAPPAPAYPITATDFRPTGTRLVVEPLVSATPDATAEQKQALRTVYLETLSAFEKEARKNNLAYALTFLLGASIQVVTGKDLPDEDAHELARGLNDILGGTPEFRRLTPQEKQSLYETAIITGGLIVVMQQMGVEQNDESLKKQARELAQTMLEKLGGQRM